MWFNQRLTSTLSSFPDIQIEMDIVVIDVPDAWGMLLSRKTGADLGGNIQMDLTYATIPTPEGTYIRLNRELEYKHHVEDPRYASNELKYKSDNLGNYAILANSLEVIEESAKDEHIIPKTTPFELEDRRLYECNAMPKNAILCGLAYVEFTKVI